MVSIMPGEIFASFKLPLTARGYANLTDALERVYGTGDIMLRASDDHIHAVAPAEGFGKLKTGKKPKSPTADELRIISLNIADGTIKVSFDEGQGSVNVMMATMKQWFEMVGGINYVEQAFRDAADESQEFVFVMQRVEGITPHQARLAAEARVAELELELELLRREMSV